MMTRQVQAFTIAGVWLALIAATGLAWSAEAVWQPVACVPADLPAEEMFDVVQPVDDSEGATPKWVVAVGDQHARAAVHRDAAERHAGGASLRVDYDFVGKRDYEYIQLNGQAGFATPGLGFGFWLKQDGTPLVVRLRFIDASGEWHQIDMLHTDRPGWQFVAGTLDQHSTAWGGDGNQRKDYPLKLAAICLDRPQAGFVGKGRVWIDDAAVVRLRPVAAGSLQVQTQAPRFGNLYSVGDAVTLRAHGPGDCVRWRVTDFFDRERARGEGAAGGAEIRFILSQPGWFCCHLEAIAGGRVVGANRFPCAALPGGAEAGRSDFVGVGTHFGQNAYPLETLDLMCRYGLDQYRDEITWRYYETQQGRYAMPEFVSAYLKRSAQLQMRLLIIFDYNNPHYDDDGFPNSPAAIAGFAAYAADLARQTRGTVSMFEVWNEWVGGCGMGGRQGVHDGDAYGRLLRPAYAAVKKARPDATVVGIGGEYGPKCAENILGAVRTAGPNAMDAWSIHPYRYPNSPEKSDLVGEVAGIARKVAAAGVKTKTWVTEIGYPTHRTSGGCDEATQARYCVRTLALLQATGVVEKAFWYDLKDDGLAREYNEHNFGLIHHQQFHCAPKPGIVAMSVFVRHTGGATFRELHRNDGVYCARYRRADGSDLLLVWTEKGNRRLTLAGQLDCASDLMGAPLPATSLLEATENPIYLVGKNLVVGK
jgi:hypothetical protein